MNHTRDALRLLIGITMVFGLFLATAATTRANHEEFGVCHAISGPNQFVFISPSQSGSHLDENENPGQGHEGDRAATAEELAAGECFGETGDDDATDDTTDATDDATDATDDATDDTTDAADATDDAVDDATDDAVDDTADDGADDGVTETTDDATDDATDDGSDDGTTDTADDGDDEGTDATTLPNTGQGGPTGGAIGTTNLLLGAFVILMMMGGWQFRHATRANRIK